MSGGSIGSPQLLLLSGIGPTEELEAVGVTPTLDLPVGRNLHNHVAATINYIIDDLDSRSLGNQVKEEDEGIFDEVRSLRFPNVDVALSLRSDGDSWRLSCRWAPCPWRHSTSSCRSAPGRSPPRG